MSKNEPVDVGPPTSLPESDGTPLAASVSVEGAPLVGEVATHVPGGEGTLISDTPPRHVYQPHITGRELALGALAIAKKVTAWNIGGTVDGDRDQAFALWCELWILSGMLNAGGTSDPALRAYIEEFHHSTAPTRNAVISDAINRGIWRHFGDVNAILMGDLVYTNVAVGRFDHLDPSRALFVVCPDGKMETWAPQEIIGSIGINRP